MDRVWLHIPGNMLKSDGRILCGSKVCNGLVRKSMRIKCSSSGVDGQKKKRSDVIKESVIIGLGSFFAPLAQAEQSTSTLDGLRLSELPIQKVSTAEAFGEIADGSLSKVMLSTLADCKLAVSIYPMFSYNAGGGGGVGTLREAGNGKYFASWDANQLDIPPLDYRSTKVLGIPIPPPLKIVIKPKSLEGVIDMETGKADLDFVASFEFEAGLYHAKPLSVATTLTTDTSSGSLLRGTGEKIHAQGKARLVGVAQVPKTGDGFLDSFLMLPSEALAVLSADLQFT
jgi:hypothetical protein